MQHPLEGRKHGEQIVKLHRSPSPTPWRMAHPVAEAAHLMEAADQLWICTSIPKSTGTRPIGCCYGWSGPSPTAGWRGRPRACTAASPAMSYCLQALQLFEGMEQLRFMAVLSEVAALGQGGLQINELGTSSGLKTLPGN